MSKYKGFTLSEVMITIVIIGVIAAIAIPVLYESYLKTQTVAQLKKAYSELCQAVNRAKVIHGDVAGWNFNLSTSDFFDTYLTPYIKVSQKTKSQTGNKYYRCDGREEKSYSALYDGAIIKELNSGMQIFTSTRTSTVTSETIIIDINGYKKPNKFGRDLFAFTICADANGVIAKQNDDGENCTIKRTRDQLLNGYGSNNYHCSKRNGRGIWCSALLMKDNWQIKKDYPW